MTKYADLSPDQQLNHKSAALTCACEELRYYAGKVGECLRISLKTRMTVLSDADSLIEEIETATPETAAELFTRARELCRDMEKILAK